MAAVPELVRPAPSPLEALGPAGRPGSLDQPLGMRGSIERRELVSLADGAALSGSQELDLDALHAGRLILDPGEAQATALAVLGAEPKLQAQASATPASVRVEVEREIPTVLLRLVGLPSLTVKAHGFSAAAKEKIEAAGGSCELID